MLSNLRSWRESLTPVSAGTDFRETGQISPEEFVAAGEYLCHQFPTWSWAVEDSALLKRDFLPTDRQYLVCKDVPCVVRAREGDGILDPGMPKVVETEADEDGFVQTTLERAVPLASSAQAEAPATASTTEEQDTDGFVLTGGSNDRPGATLQTRTYDLFITYDKYYRTPRLCESPTLSNNQFH